MRLAVVALLLAAGLGGCVDDEPDPVTIVMMMANGQSESNLAYFMGGHDPGDENVQFGGIRATRILPPGDVELQTARLRADSVDRYTWFFQVGTEGQKATFTYDGCPGIWVLEARVVDDGDTYRMFTSQRCD